ncbi:MAG: glycosyl hydrolase family 18 [Lachnospiraceae bacterium]|nr:glycosyl hydrolase family 18 [Lachnospiraceae bacterium]
MRYRRENEESSGEVRESFRERSLREHKEKSQGIPKGKIAVLVVLLVVFIVIVSVLVKKISSSNTVMDLNEYYKVADDKVMVVLHDTIAEEQGLYDDNQIYLPYNVVTDNINKRFYFDSTENTLSFATATEIIRTEVGSNDYYVNRSKTSVGYPIVRTEGENVYLALDFVEQFTDIKYEFYQQPNRIVVESNWGEKYSYYTVNKATKLRYAQSKKSDILASLEEKDVLRVISDEEELVEGYTKVMTKDGVIGYVPGKYLSEIYEKKLKGGVKEEAYPHISKDKTINMVWHQITNSVANNSILNDLANTKGLNCISPTWFSISSNEGTISSLASETYVSRAHNSGVEVWALCDDFKAATDEIDLATVLGNTTNRDKLTNALIANAIQYNLDGINIDFEHISAKTAEAYLEFLRELSVKCRNNGIVLSVDSYVPTEYTAFYDREEQGKIVDYVVVMAYDEHYGGSEESGSVASIGFVEEAVNNIVKMVDPSQVIIGMPFYTRLWKESILDGETKVTSSAHSMNQASNILSQNGVKPEWDKTTGQYYAEYTVGKDLYKIWLEEDKSIEEKLKVIFADHKQGKVAGVASWKLGLEKSDIWNIILKYVN